MDASLYVSDYTISLLFPFFSIVGELVKTFFEMRKNAINSSRRNLRILAAWPCQV